MRRGLFVSFVFALFLPQFVFAGAADYQSPGSYSFTVPTYGSLTVQVWGAGGSGGGGGCAGATAIGGAGGQSYFNGSVVGNGGGGGNAQVGAGGSASGGDTNLSGASGSGTSGGGSPNGGAGGTSHGTGGWPGGGGAGGCKGGGGGGYSSKTYSSGQLTVNSSISIVVGTGGAPSRTGSIVGNPANGGNGRVYISWTSPPAPTCSVWADTNPIDYQGNTTLHWTSSNSDTSLFISNYGYVTPNQAGSIAIGGNTANTAYNCTAVGPGGTTNNTYTLTVNPPATCTFNGNTVNHSSSVTAYQTATVPYDSSCVSETRTCSNGTLSGSYTFATCNRNCTFNGSAVDHDSSVTAYQSATVPQGQSCAAISETRTCTNGTLSGSYTYSSCSLSCPLSWSCTGADNQTITQVNMNCTTSELATCTLPTNFCSTGLSYCVNPAPIFNSSGDFTGHLQARPSLVRKGDSTKLYWDVDNVLSCSVAGNGETFDGTSGSGIDTALINNRTDYTLTCLKLPNGATSFSETVPLYITPTMHEL